MEKLTSKEEEVMELIWQLTNEARAEGKLAGTMPGKEEEGRLYFTSARASKY